MQDTVSSDDTTSPKTYRIETAIYKKQIDHPENPAKNHPIHDAVEKIVYAGGRFVFGLVLDGVSETKSQKKLVPIGRMLCWDLARYCAQESPSDLEQIIDWFRESTGKPEYMNKGATTVSLIRFDRKTGIIDGFNLGDSVTMMVVEQAGTYKGKPRMIRRAAVLAPLHSVANECNVVYQCWRHNRPFEPDRFKLSFPKQLSRIHLVAMSDGFAKITTKVANEIYDHLRAERILTKRYPDFVRVYLPESLADLAPDVKRPPMGRVAFSQVSENQDLKKAVRLHFQGGATAQEKLELSRVDLNTMHLRSLIQARDEPERLILGRPVRELLERSHRTLKWLTKAPFNDRGDDRGIEEHLRQYLMAELFTERMIQRLAQDEEDGVALSKRLHSFGESLGQIGDDFSVAVLQISR